MRLILAISLCLALPAQAQTRADPEAGTGWDPKPAATAARNMIAAANPHAAEAGRDMLRAGGSAADATIAALLVLNVVEPQSSGIGGGAFALVHGPEGLTSFDAREIAPAAATPELFLEDGAPLPWWTAVNSGRSVGAPGLVRLMAALHDRHGKLPWPVLFGPAYKLAQSGFSVSARLAGLIEKYTERLSETAAKDLFLPGGEPLSEGDILRQPALAETLAEIAFLGSEAFYRGRIADEVAAAVRTPPRPGELSPGDLAGYRVIERAPVCLPYRGAFRVCGMGPPSSGATTVGQILGLLDRFKPTDFEAGGAHLWHLFAEASRLAYADRAAFLADMDFVKVPVKGLLDPGYLFLRSNLIHGFQASEGKATAGTPPWREGRYAPDPTETSPGTTHVSAIDADGLAISLTASIETAFGSGRMAAGFLLNNQLTDFSFRPATDDGTPIANAPAAGKRPRSSMAPTVVYLTDRPGLPYILAGSPGGSRIPEYVAGALVAMLDLGMDPAQAAALFHVSHRNRGEIALESGAAPPTLGADLSALGHTVVEKEMTSGLHIIQIPAPGMLLGGADPRREGQALGD